MLILKCMKQRHSFLRNMMFWTDILLQLCKQRAYEAAHGEPIDTAHSVVQKLKFIDAIVQAMDAPIQPKQYSHGKKRKEKKEESTTSFNVMFLFIKA